MLLVWILPVRWWGISGCYRHENAFLLRRHEGRRSTVFTSHPFSGLLPQHFPTLLIRVPSLRLSLSLVEPPCATTCSLGDRDLLSWLLMACGGNTPSQVYNSASVMGWIRGLCPPYPPVPDPVHRSSSLLPLRPDSHGATLYRIMRKMLAVVFVRWDVCQSGPWRKMPTYIGKQFLTADYERGWVDGHKDINLGTLMSDWAQRECCPDNM